MPYWILLVQISKGQFVFSMKSLATTEYQELLDQTICEYHKETSHS